jgi:predicted acyltransferase
MAGAVFAPIRGISGRMAATIVSTKRARGVTLGAPSPTRAAPETMSNLAPSRLASLDAFRGFTIASMLLVNNPGDWEHLHSQLDHAAWNGWTFTDWIFPFFLFIGGVSMTLSLGRRVDAGDDRLHLLTKLAKRAALIFLIGFLLNLIPYFHFDRVRVLGVLQRIALCTLLSAPLVVYCGWRRQLAAVISLFALYSLLMLCVPVPGVDGVWSLGALEPGRDTGAFVDRSLLSGHLWVRSKTWDPEGLLSTLPAIASQVLGVLLMPINKSLWTPSYAIFTTGWALIVFAAFYWLLDANPSTALRAQAARCSRPFIIYGMNALFIFTLSGFVAKMAGYVKIAKEGGGDTPLGALLYAPIKALPLAPENSSLLYALLFNGVMFAVAWALWRRRIFIKA